MYCENEKLNIILENIINDISLCLTVNEIRIFGSQLDSPNPDSDIDLVIFCNDNTEYDNIISKLGIITCKFKQFIHPVIYEKNIGEIEKNEFINNYILRRSKIIFKAV
jgi:predicted nucleotidyltransferase